MKELIKRLRKILDTVEMADDIRERLERLLEALEGGEPTDIVIARLLADLLELGADRLPGPVGDFVKAYAEAFRNAIDAILAVLWKRYREARRAGLDHQEANDLVTFDAKICEWLRFRWLLEQFDESREAAGDGERGKRYTWRRLQVSAQEPREILVHVRAVSACIGVLDRMVRIG